MGSRRARPLGGLESSGVAREAFEPMRAGQRRKDRTVTDG
jgi:hypothetical protein